MPEKTKRTRCNSWALMSGQKGHPVSRGMRPSGNVRCNYYQRALPQHCFRREFTFTANHGLNTEKHNRGDSNFYLPAFCSVSFVNF